MGLDIAGRLAIIATMMTGPMMVAAAQQPDNTDASLGFNDPVFWQLVARGPETSAELELVVGTYAANEMTNEATGIFVEYLSRGDSASDAHCTYCRSLLLATVGMPEDDGRLAGALRDAIDIVAENAFETGASSRLVRLAVIAGASSHREHQDLALYLLTMAAQLGIDDAWRDDVVGLLAAVGFYAEALTIAESIYENPGSAHFQSHDLGRWITYLDDVLERNRQVGSIVSTAATN